MERLRLVGLGLLFAVILVAIFATDLVPTLHPVVPQVQAKRRQEKKHETEGMSPGRYPASVDDLLLHCSYNQAKPGRLTSMTARERSLNYPIFPAHHIGTNNMRYWRKPTNGQCAPGELCGGFYDDTPQNIPGPAQAPANGPGIIRVNYYDSTTPP